MQVFKDTVREVPPAPAEEEVSRDASLLWQSRHGNAGAFDALVRRHQGRVHTLFLAYTGDEGRASAAACAAFQRAAISREAPAAHDSFLAWLLGFGLERLRARGELRRMDAFAAIDARSCGAAAERRWRALAALAPETRLCFALRVIGGLGYGDIARLARIPAESVGRRLNQARWALCAALPEECGAGGAFPPAAQAETAKPEGEIEAAACVRARADFSALLDHELGEGERAAIERHLGTSSADCACLGTLGAYKRISKAYASLPLVPAPPGFGARVRRGIRARRIRARVIRGLRRFGLTSAALAAAGLAAWQFLRG